MRIRLNEGKSDRKIDGELPKKFYAAVDAGDLEGVKRYGMVILERSKGLCPENDSLRVEADGLMQEFDETESVDGVNGLLDALYDFCDDYSIALSEEDAGGEAKKVDVTDVTPGE